MSAFMQDVRYAFRSLIKNPGFTSIVLLTLALGIGANSAIYSVVDTVLLRPLPYPDADRLVILQESDRLNGTRFEGFSLPDFFDVQERNEVFDAMATFVTPTTTITATGFAPTTSSSASNPLPSTGDTPKMENKRYVVVVVVTITGSASGASQFTTAPIKNQSCVRTPANNASGIDCPHMPRF